MGMGDGADPTRVRPVSLFPHALSAAAMTRTAAIQPVALRCKKLMVRTKNNVIAYWRADMLEGLKSKLWH